MQCLMSGELITIDENYCKKHAIPEVTEVELKDESRFAMEICIGKNVYWIPKSFIKFHEKW